MFSGLGFVVNILSKSLNVVEITNKMKELCDEQEEASRVSRKLDFRIDKEELNREWNEGKIGVLWLHFLVILVMCGGINTSQEILILKL